MRAHLVDDKVERNEPRQAGGDQAVDERGPLAAAQHQNDLCQRTTPQVSAAAVRIRAVHGAAHRVAGDRGLPPETCGKKIHRLRKRNQHLLAKHQVDAGGKPRIEV